MIPQFDIKHYVLGILLLAVLFGCTTEAERNRMRAGLDSINVLNRTDQPFTPDDVRPYVDFFDKEAKAFFTLLSSDSIHNDQLLAHYLLGRAYHEKGDAPMALESYQHAIDHADTTSASCDYKQLSRVYAQMADLFYFQGLYREQMKNTKASVYYAWSGKDTLAALMSYEQLFLCYNSLGLIDSAIYVIEDVAHRYDNLGYTNYAATSLGLIMKPLVETGDYIKARKYMHRYESETGLFDSSGNIAKGREVYYKIKGLYYFYNNVLDSAEYYFRKELHDGKDFHNQHSAAQGLILLYQKLDRIDSIAKYSLYAYAMNDSLNAQNQAKELKRIQSMYDYSCHQEEARKEKIKATLANQRLLVSLVILLVISLVASWLYIARKQVMENLRKSQIALNTYRVELRLLQQDKSASEQCISEKERRIRQLEQKMGRYAKLVYFGSEVADNNLKMSPNYQKVKAMAYKGQSLSAEEWKIIGQLIGEYFPGCYDFLLSKLKADSIEYKICLLLRLHFKAGDIANMLGFSSAYVSKVSSEILKKTFNKKGSSKELSTTLCKIF